MFTRFKEKNIQREMRHISLSLEEAMEVTEVEVEEDLVAEEEAKSPAIIVDNYDIWLGNSNYLLEYTVITVMLRTM